MAAKFKCQNCGEEQDSVKLLAVDQLVPIHRLNMAGDAYREHVHREIAHVLANYLLAEGCISITETEDEVCSSHTRFSGRLAIWRESE